MYRIGLSTVAKTVDEDLFVKYREAGISAVEFSIKDYAYSTFDYSQAAAWARKHNVEPWSCHLPYQASERMSLVDRSVQKKTIEYLSDIIKRASDAGIGKFITHSSAGGINDENREESKKCSKEIIAAIADVAKKNGSTIVIENLPPICIGRTSDEVMEMLAISDDLRACVDMNHFLMGETPADYIRKLGDKIVSVHVSDYDLVNERHWLPGEGVNDWQSILSALKEVNYKGVWLYEVAFIPVHTIERSRDLVCEDFVRNANEIFGNKEITALGKPAKGLYEENV